jgi:hypothetical protein
MYVLQNILVVSQDPRLGVGSQPLQEAGARYYPGRDPCSTEFRPASPERPSILYSTPRELAAQAFADLLRKHGRSVDLKTALRQSVGEIPSPSASPSRKRCWRSPTR